MRFNNGVPSFRAPRDGGFPRRESPRGLGPSDEPIKKHYAHIKEEFISLALHSARSLSVNEVRRSTVKMPNSSTLNFFYDMNDDVIDELSDYLGKDTCYQLTRAFPLLLTNLNLQWKSNEYITANPYKCIPCRKRGSTDAQLRLHNETTHREAIEIQLQKFYSVGKK